MSKIECEQLSEELSAYIDGELDAEQTARVEHLLREDEAARRLLEELRRTVKLVSSLPRHPAPSSIAEDVRSHAERSELLGGLEQPGARVGGRQPLFRAVLSTAAVLTLLVGGLWFLAGDKEPGNAPREDMVAMALENDSERALRHSADAERIPAKAQHSKQSGVGRRRGRSLERLATQGTLRERESQSEESTPSTEFDTGKNLIATASLEQKLSAGMDLHSIRTHVFSNERVRLQVIAQDEGERDTITNRLLAYLADQRVVDLVKVTDSHSAGGPATGSFYYQGTEHVNFPESNARQILVRASRRQLDGMLDEVADATKDGDGDTVALVSGPLTIRGLKQTRTALNDLGEPVSPGAFTSRSHEHAPKMRRTPDQPWDGRDEPFDDFIKAIGLDQEILSRATKPSPDTGPESAQGGTAVQSLAHADGDYTGERKNVDALVQQPQSLVSRRVQELEERREGRAQATGTVTGVNEQKSSHRSKRKGGGASRIGQTVTEMIAEPYVTLVIQVIVARPEPTQPANGTKSTPESGVKRATKVPPAE